MLKLQMPAKAGICNGLNDSVLTYFFSAEAGASALLLTSTL